MPPWSILVPRPDPADFSGDPAQPYTRTVSDSPPRLHPLVFGPIDLSVPLPDPSPCPPVTSYASVVHVSHPSPCSIEASSPTSVISSTASVRTVEVNHTRNSPYQASSSVSSVWGSDVCAVAGPSYTDSLSSLARPPILRKPPTPDIVHINKNGVQHIPRQIRALPKIPTTPVTSKSYSDPIGSGSMRTSAPELASVGETGLQRTRVSTDYNHSSSPMSVRPLPTPCRTPTSEKLANANADTGDSISTRGRSLTGPRSIVSSHGSLMGAAGMSPHTPFASTSSGHFADLATTPKNQQVQPRDRRTMRKLPTPPTQYASR